MAIWRRAYTPVMEIPSATDGHGWMKDGDDNMMPVWFEGDRLPNILINDDVLPDNVESDDNDCEDDNTVTVPDTDRYDYWMDVTYINAWS